MTTINKYYQPSIEEFHVGFEYEFSEGGPWYKREFKSNDYNMLNSPLFAVRVKYLDKEDIESLGFVEIGQEEYYLNGDLNSWNIERLYKEGNPCYYRIELPGDYGGFSSIMFLTIKNKSELKKLLTQLGIEYGNKRSS